MSSALLARAAITAAVLRGEIPPAKALLCLDCGDEALDYHHYRGYGPRYWGSVIPLCRSCHKRQHWFRQTLQSESSVISFRATQEQALEIKLQATALGVSVSKYLKMLHEDKEAQRAVS